jgi:tetratricopeptide (TPR) repeat protein
MEAAKNDPTNGSGTPAETTEPSPAQTATQPAGTNVLPPVPPPPQAEPGKTAAPIRPQVRPHAFVIMPFGKKKSADGSMIYDFNAIYSQIIKPALEAAGFESFRADEETTSGDILTDMFQELLLADLCIADLSIDNANVFYELGIRHSLRKRGIVHIQAGRSYMPFDVFNVRTIPYHITTEGVPDPAFLEKDRAAISRVVLDTWTSEQETVHSPIFNLLDGLIEPDRRTLRTPLARGFWREYNQWRERVNVAQRQKRIGDILLLTEEIQNPLIKEDAIGEAGQALRSMDRHELALVQYRKGLEVNPRNMTFRREEAFSLNRLGRADEAIIRIENLLQDMPNDGEAIAYLGRVYKEMWYQSWKTIPDKEVRLKAAFEAYHWLIKSFETYLRGYRCNLNRPDAYPGVNALTLGKVLIYLADRFDDPKAPDPEIQWVRAILPDLEGTLIFSLESRTHDENVDYWTLISFSELRVLTTVSQQEVNRAYRKAITASRRNLFSIQSSLGQLEMLRLLELRPEFVLAGIHILEDEMERIRRDKALKESQPRKKPSQKKTGNKKRDRMVFLFTGYMVSHSGKNEDQISPDKEDELKMAINAILDKHGADSGDLAVTTGMDAGSELIFVECCTERGMSVQAYFAETEAAYLRDFVSPAGDDWVDRFFKMRNHPRVDEYYQPDCVGLPKEGDNPHERNNRWALYSALAYGIDNVRLIAVWDGKNEPSSDLDSRLVKHMVELMRDAGGRIEQIHPHKLARYALLKGKPATTSASVPTVKPRSGVNGKGSSPKKAPAHKK